MKNYLVVVNHFIIFASAKKICFYVNN